MKQRVIVIGLDGATFTLLKPWMEEGHLPFLKSLVDQGVSGPLQSSIPPVTAPALQCFMTGKNPGKHGIKGFMRVKPNSYQETLIEPMSCKGKTLWEILSEEGNSVAVLNVPFTYPPPHFNGVMIGGFNTPPSLFQEVSHPPGLLKEIEAKFGEYQMTLKTPPFLVDRSDALIAEYIKSCSDLTDYQCNTAHYILGREDFDFVMFYQITTDRIQHKLWYILDQAHPLYDQEISRKFYDKILAYYHRLDEHMARLAEKMGEDATVIILSDHGFGQVTKAIDLNSWLLREGYLAIKQRPLSQLKYLLWKMGWGPNLFFHRIAKGLLRLGSLRHRFQRALRRFSARVGPQDPSRIINAIQRLFLSLNDLDWHRTKAYCQAGPGLIRLNVQGREPQGSVRPEDYEALRAEIVAKLERLIDPLTGEKVEGKAFLREQIYKGDFLQAMPDIVYVSMGDYFTENTFAFSTSKTTTNDLPFTGSHRMDGIFIAKGPAVRKHAIITGATIMDVAPTILYLMGSQIPVDMDGKVLKGFFDEEFLQTHPILYTETGPEAEGGKVVELTQDDQRAVLERLRGLGYID